MFDHISSVQSKDKIELFNRFKPGGNYMYYLLWHKGTLRFATHVLFMGFAWFSQ
jgi:hypothetical protein